MLRLLSTLFLLILGVLCVWVAVENRTLVAVTLGPLGSIDVPLFFVFFAGLALGMVAIAFRAGASRLGLGLKLRKSNAQIETLKEERDAVTIERDQLAARVRPEDDRQKAAQISDIPAPGSLIGPASAQQSVLPG